ncbi:MAG: hypothetical protein QXH03_02715 [Candidatus Bathyarchaeia archaeon]
MSVSLRPIYPEEKNVRFAGAITDLAALSSDEVAIFRDQLQKIMSEVNPSVAKIISANAEVLINLIRRVKTETKSSFKGATARGKELTIELCRPSWFLRNGTPITTWLYTATAGTSWFISGAGNAPVALPEDEGFAFLAWADPIDTPKAEAIQLEKGGDLYVPESLPWDLTKEYPVIPLKEPWVILPEDSYRIQVRYNISGDDKLQPIAFRVVKAEAIMSI